MIHLALWLAAALFLVAVGMSCLSIIILYWKQFLFISGIALIIFAVIIYFSDTNKSESFKISSFIGIIGGLMVFPLTNSWNKEESS